MRCYEEYKTPAEKRKAQRTAKPKGGKPTGLAYGYLLVFNEDGYASPGSGVYNAIGELMGDTKPGGDPQTLTHVTPSLDFLSKNCRKVGFAHIPQIWRRAIANKMREWIDTYEGDERRKYDRILRLAEKP